MGLIERIKSFIAPAGALPPTVRSPRSEYMRGNRTVTMNRWNPALREPAQDIGQGWDRATARAMDLIQNSGWISGIVDQAVANTVGSGLRLKAAPENSLFGMDDVASRTWSQNVEQRFELWANNAFEFDIEGRLTFGKFQAQAFRSWFAFGEIFAEMPYRKRSVYGTKTRLVLPSRIPRVSNTLINACQGVVMDNDGLPIGYIVTRIDPILGRREELIAARDEMDRPRVIHVYDSAGYRGITPLVPVLQVAKQFDQLSDATLMASIVQSVFAATIKSSEPTEELLTGLLTPQEQAQAMQAGLSTYDAWFAAQEGWYEKGTIDVGINGRINHLFPGQEMDFHSAENPSNNYRDFAMHLLREIARCAGLTYESATGDWEGATYASAKLATTEIFQITNYRRANIIAPLCQPIYECWLEEEIETGGIPFPGGIENFHANRGAACRALWRGSPKPQADDLKIAKSHETWRNMGVISDTMIANDLGADIEDVYAQRAAELEMRKRLGLPESKAAVTQIAPPGFDDNGDPVIDKGAANGN